MLDCLLNSALAMLMACSSLLAAVVAGVEVSVSIDAAFVMGT